MQSADRPRRPVTVWVLLVLLVIQGLGGLAGGLSLSLRPDGSVMGMPTSLLDGSPFSDFLIPGLILLLVLGVLPLVAVAGLWMRRRWAWYAAFVVGCGLMIWILVEITIVPFRWLQPAFGVRRRADLRRLAAQLRAPVLRRAAARRRRGLTRPGRSLAGPAPSGAGTAVRADNTGSCRLAPNMPMQTRRDEASGSFRARRHDTTARVPHVRGRRSGSGAPSGRAPARRRRHLPRPGADQRALRGERGDFIRASLLTRLRHCTSALCLYGASTADDDWVRWALGDGRRAQAPSARRRPSRRGRRRGRALPHPARRGTGAADRDAIVTRARAARDAAASRARSTRRRSSRRCTSCATRSASTVPLRAPARRSSSPPR